MHRLITGLAALEVTLSLGGAVGAQELAAGKLGDHELLQAYWYCDDQASRSANAEARLDETLMQLCGAISHELQHRKFDGDFGKLLQWTRTHRGYGRDKIDVPAARTTPFQIQGDISH